MVRDRRYDVVIVGAGPAGIFAALELTKQAKLDVLILDKGRDIDKRHCPIYNSDRKCIHCNFCDRISGWGGAGAYSDGKLTLSNEVGGQLQDVIGPEALAIWSSMWMTSMWRLARQKSLWPPRRHGGQSDQKGGLGRDEASLLPGAPHGHRWLRGRAARYA